MTIRQVPNGQNLVVGLKKSVHPGKRETSFETKKQGGSRSDVRAAEKPLHCQMGDVSMRKIMEWVLISADGGMEYQGPPQPGSKEPTTFLSFRDAAYLRDGLGTLKACDAMLMGRTMYEASAQLWPTRASAHPWAARLNEMQKYVFSTKLLRADWNNTKIVRGDVVAEARKLKEQTGGDLVIWGNTKLAEALMRAKLIDQLDLDIHPVLVGSGRRLFRDGLDASLNLVAARTYAKIVHVTYDVS
jgi:dihydrofolate reductase